MIVIGKFQCLLYGHNPVKPAGAIGGDCYTLRDRVEDALEVDDDDDDDDEDEEMDEEDEEDLEKYYKEEDDHDVEGNKYKC